MTSYRVQWTNDGSSVELDLIDSLGPKNNYKFLDPNAMIPATGEFYNQFSRVTPDDPSWTMLNFDNDVDYSPGEKGNGEVFITHIGSFPEGVFQWEIVQKLP